jgi:hypothetical protein
VRAAQGKWVAVEFEGKAGKKGYRGHVISYDEKEDSHTVRWLDVGGAAARRLGYISLGYISLTNHFTLESLSAVF